MFYYIVITLICIFVPRDLVYPHTTCHASGETGEPLRAVLFYAERSRDLSASKEWEISLCREANRICPLLANM